MVMLHLLKVVLDYPLVVAHVNYKKRGAESDKDQKLVTDFCHSQGIPVYAYDADKDADLRDSRGNFQDYARRIRRAFFCEVMQDAGAAAVALAHHREDQSETIFQKLLRGSAPEHWGGMPVYDPPWLRPLLMLSRKSLEAYARRNKVPWRTDQTNLESEYARNLLRNKVFPQLENHFPGWRVNLQTIAGFGAMHKDMLDYLVADVTARQYSGGPAPARDGSNTYVTRKSVKSLIRSRWLQLPQSLQSAVARHWIREQTGFTGWSRGDMFRLNDLRHIETGAEVMISERLRVIRDRDSFVLAQPHSFPDPVSIADTGEMKSSTSGSYPRADTRFEETIRVRELGDTPAHLLGYRFSTGTYETGRHKECLQLRINALPEILTLRFWEAGERFQPLGMQGHQLISDHLTNRKIASDQKNETLVLVSFDRKIHAVIFPHSLHGGEMGTIAEHARCHAEGEAVLLINKLNKTDEP